MNASRRLLCLGTTLFFALPLHAAPVKGKVVAPDHTPIAGATIVILSSDYQQVVKAQSGADGTWTADVPEVTMPLQNMGTIDEATLKMLRQRLGTVIVAAPGKTFFTGLVFKDKVLESELFPATSVGGTVVDGKGAPVAGALVQLQGFSVGEDDMVYFSPPVIKVLSDLLTAKTDATGHWKLDGIRVGAQANVILADERFARTAVTVESGDLDKTLPAQPGAMLKGRVLFPDGKPAPGLMVMGNGQESQQTDAEGRFTIAKLPPGRPWYRIADPKNEWLAEEKAAGNLAAGETVDLGDIKLTKGMQVKGKLVDEEGHPVEGANVSASGPTMPGITDKDGNFQMRTLPGNIWLWVNKEGFLSLTQAQRRVQIDAAAPEQTLPPITIKHGVYLEGTARDQAGQPAVGAHILSGARYTDGTVEAEADKEGHFRLGPLAPGSTVTLEAIEAWDLVKTEKITVPSLKTTATAPKLALTFQKFKALELTGRVVTPDGKPAKGIGVRFLVPLDSQGRSQQYREATSTAQGSISLGNLRPTQTPKFEKVLSDSVVLVTPPTITREGDGWKASDIVVSALDGELKGVILDAGGAPVAGAKVAVTGELNPKIIESDTTGHFTLDKLPRSEVTVLAAKGHSFKRQTATPAPGVEVQIRLEDRPTPTQSDGAAMLQGKPGGHSGYILATAVPVLAPDAILSLVKRNGDTVDVTAMGVVLGAMARRSPQIAATWGVEQWGKLNLTAMNKEIALSTGAALARAATTYNPAFATAWYTDQRAKIAPNDFSAEAADRYFMLAGIAATLGRPEATNLVDLGLTAADHSVHGDILEQKLDDWGQALAASPELLERLTQDMEPMQRVQVVSGAVAGLARTDVGVARKQLDQLVQLTQTPEVKAADAKVMADRENSNQWHATSSEFVVRARQSLIAALANQPGPAATQMAGQLPEDYQKAPALLYVARHHLAAGRQDDALVALRALPDADQNALASAAALALPLDKGLAEQLFQNASRQFFGNAIQYGGDYRPSAAAYSLYHAPLDAADAWIRLEGEWAWRQTHVQPNNTQDDEMRSVAIAMGALDLQRAGEMLSSIKTNPQQNEFALTHIGLYLATGGQTNPLNPWQTNEF